MPETLTPNAELHRHRLTARPRIGVFDSGVGGLGVLLALQRAIPGADFVYVADTAHAPYGDKPVNALTARSRVLTEFLRRHPVDLIVIACNTATAAAIDELRQHHLGFPIVGIEPALKPAAALTRTGHVGVMATTRTLDSPRVRRLLHAQSPHLQFHFQACPGLADAIENSDPDSPALEALIEKFCAPLRAALCDVVVLGCTHYPFAAPAIQRALGPSVTLIDPADAVARRAASLLGVTSQPHDTGTVEFYASAEPAKLYAFATRYWPSMAMPGLMSDQI